MDCHSVANFAYDNVNQSYSQNVCKLFVLFKDFDAIYVPWPQTKHVSIQHDIALNSILFLESV